MCPALNIPGIDNFTHLSLVSGTISLSAASSSSVNSYFLSAKRFFLQTDAFLEDYVLTTRHPKIKFRQQIVKKIYRKK
jgi:hypothetical protein